VAKIVLGIGTSHSPMLNTPPEMWHLLGEGDKTHGWLVDQENGLPISYEALLAKRGDAPWHIDEETFRSQWAQCQAALKALGETIREAAPDILVIVSADQRELLFDDNMPALLIYWGDTIPLLRRHLPASAPPVAAEAAWGYGDVDMDLPVESALGKHLIEQLVANEFDVSHARYVRPDAVYGGDIGPAGYIEERYVTPPRRQGIGHGWGFVIKRLLDNQPIPIVPVLQNATFPPNMPTPKRCYDTGAAIRSAIERWDSNKRVCVIASGGMSHWVTDEKLDRATLTAIVDKDESTLCSLPLERLNAASAEIRNWVTVAAACAHLDAELVDYVPVYRTEAGTGGGWAFMRWSEPTR
jgi:3-O-methylgallate 3,4-dioxygenase